MKNISKNISIILLAVVLAVSCTSAPAGDGAENAAAGPGFDGITGIEWRLVGVSSSAEIAAARFSRRELAEIGMENAYTLRFDEGRLGGTAAPNGYFAPYEEGAGKTLSVKAVAGTLMAGIREPESLKEREYFVYLENAGRWDLIRNQLHIYTRDGQGREAVLIFDAG
ncbi:MAG: META domain-containing protein [Treponema sp.]|jgi:hypothetical protein|nr:META domain-containing protein [Treponema sp.]